MPDLTAFHETLARVRRGDPLAVAAFVRDYQPFLLRTARRRFGDDLRAAADSADVCQSVLMNFLVRAGNGEFEFQSPEDVNRLLAVMVRNKVASWRRREGAERRDRDRAEALGSAAGGLADTTLGPASRVANEELIRAARERLTPDERELVELRAQGLDWDAIAERKGTNAAALRKRLSRALNRVAQELGLDDAHDPAN
jgi:RNA polymerase sigma-70 factor (ECF subfamily)